MTTQSLHRLLGLFALCIVLVTVVIQHLAVLTPCPLCLLQRFSLLLFGICACLFSFLPFKGWGQKMMSAFLFLLSLPGVVLAVRHIWIIQHPNTVTSCAPSWAFMTQHMPWSDILWLSVTGSGDCTKIDWQFLGLSMPVWSLFTFGFLSIACLMLIFAKRNL